MKDKFGEKVKLVEIKDKKKSVIKDLISGLLPFNISKTFLKIEERGIWSKFGL